MSTIKQGNWPQSTVELIKALRQWAIACKSGKLPAQLCNDLNAAADRLEELDERVAIMEEGRGIESK